MDAFGIPQITAQAKGVHLSWSGPRTWVYAPGGWTVQRRQAGRRQARRCEHLDAAAIARLRTIREQALSFGVITMRSGGWLNPIDVLEPPPSNTPTDIFRVDLHEEHRFVRLVIAGKLSMVTGLCEGRVVAVSHQVAGQATHFLVAPRIDAVVAVVSEPTSLQICVDTATAADEAMEWAGVPAIVRGLTLPFRELMPNLGNAADELAEANSRLLPGEQVGTEEFGRLAAMVRPMLRTAGPPRPSAFALLLREEPDTDPDEVRALDPIRVLLAHPTWRRALGFAFFDDDPALTAGETYEYRISADFPAEDIRDPDHGFSTVGSGVVLPTDFTLDGVRMRLPQPTPVALDPNTPTDGLVRLTRRGITLNPEHAPFWLTPSLDDWSLVLDFPSPATAVVLELDAGHDLEFDAGEADDPFDFPIPLPAGPRPRLTFPNPISQLRLRGKGFLYAVRISTAKDDPLLVSAVTPPIVLAATAPPPPPLLAWVTNLQTSSTASIDLVPAGDVPPRHALGFTVFWRPQPAFGLNAWPTDLEAAVPLDSTIFEVERRAEPGGPWKPVLPDENWTLGDRDTTIRDRELTPGCEVMIAFPDSASAPSGSALDLKLTDTFPDDAEAPQPGDLVRYRVRTIDAIGRPSATYTETDPVRLEKRQPPPVPIEVEVRVLVRDAPDLTAGETSQLGNHNTMTILRWAWRDDQRVQDPFATEFRVYSAPPMDTVTGAVIAHTTIGTGRVTSYQVDLQLDREVPADIAAGLRLNAGHPFLIVSHTAGSSITMLVETRLRFRGQPPAPTAGPIRLQLPLTPDRSRPPAWGPRATVVPITAATEYEVVLPDQLSVSADEPYATVWVGVSNADDQAYIPDQLAPVENRPGNESAIVAMQATARYAGRPELEIPPPLAAVPQLRTPEPGAEPIHFPLDLTGFLPALGFARVRPERVSVGALLGACTVTADDRILARPVDPRSPGDADTEIPIGNPGDRTELVAALRSGRSTEVDDRFLVYLAGHHRYRDRLFAPATDSPVAAGSFGETLPPNPDRWIYRMRAVDAAGHVSAGSATARVVVRVPSLQAGAPPQKLPREQGDAPELVRVRIADDPSLTHLLLFATPSVGNGPVEVNEVVRVPNRPDLLPDGGLYQRAPDGSLLTPTATAVQPGQDVTVTVPGLPGDRTRIWLATLTIDGIPSALAGPYTVLLPVEV